MQLANKDYPAKVQAWSTGSTVKAAKAIIRRFKEDIQRLLKPLAVFICLWKDFDFSNAGNWNLWYSRLRNNDVFFQIAECSSWVLLVLVYYSSIRAGKEALSSGLCWILYIKRQFYCYRFRIFYNINRGEWHTF